MSSKKGSTPEPAETPEQVLDAARASSHLAQQAFDAAVRVIPSQANDERTQETPDDAEGPTAVMKDRRPGKGSDMDDGVNTSGTRLSCTNSDCPCELQIKTPCPHGASYTCACGHPFEAVSQES